VGSLRDSALAIGRAAANAQIKRWVELARIEARRRRHEAVEPEHFALVCVGDASFAAAVTERGIDPTELRERLEGALTARPTVGGYRDASDAPISPELQRVIERARPRGWLPLAKPLSAHDSLSIETSIAALVFDLRRGNDHRHILERARALAVIHGHALVTVQHVLRTLLDLRSFVEAIERAYGDVAPLRAARLQTLDGMTGHAEPRAPLLDPAMKAVVGAAQMMARSYGPAPASVRQFCLQLAVAPDCERYWPIAGIEASDFVRAVHLPDARPRAGLLR
jgi:ATP-dependent Clp protease ATP-binding subunit ClpA